MNARAIFAAAVTVVLTVFAGGWLVHDDLAKRDALARSVPAWYLLHAPDPGTGTYAWRLPVVVEVSTAAGRAACKPSGSIWGPEFLPNGFVTDYPSGRRYMEYFCLRYVPVSVSYDRAGNLSLVEAHGLYADSSPLYKMDGTRLARLVKK